MTDLIEFPKNNSNEENVILQLDSDDGFSFDFDDDISFDFDDDVLPSDSYIDALYEVEKLYRMIGKGDYKTFYILKESEIESKQISLFNLKNPFLTNNAHLCQNDCFLKFMFYIVMAKSDLNEKYLQSRRIANLITRKVAQLAKTDDIFRKKIEHLSISKLSDQNYIDHADHWDLKYIDESYCKDDDLQQLLFSCTKVTSVSSDFEYKDNLVH